MDAISTVADAAPAGRQVVGHVLHHIDAVPLITPVLGAVTARNAEGAIQAGATAMKVLKGAGAALAAGAVVGSGAVLFVAGAAAAVAGPVALVNFIGRKMKDRRLKKEQEELNKKTVTSTATASPAPA
jgi:hypothetical protein